MKYIKLLSLLILTIILSGCSKEYQLYISDDSIVEKFHMEIDSENKYSYILDGNFYPLHNDFNHKFNKKITKENNNRILDLEYTYSLKDFINANSFNQCFDDRNIINSNKYYSISLSKPNGCMFNESYTINIITDNKVINNDADKVKRNQYIWYVNQDNKEVFNLNIKIAKGKKRHNISQKNLGIFASLLIIILFFIKHVLKKRKKANSI